MATETDTMKAYCIQIEVEAAALARTLLVAEEMQWDAAPRVSNVDEETSDRKATRGPNDPTGDAAVDEARLALREQIVRSERIVKHALVSVVGVRRGLELAMDRWNNDSADVIDDTRVE